MDIKDIKAHLRAEREETEELPWLVRTAVKVGEFFQYRVKGYVESFPREFMWEIQSFIRGYSDSDVWNLNSYLINKLRAPLKKFVQNQAEHGLSLPQQFATDPAAWLEILKKIEFSVDHAWRDEHEKDYFPTRNMGIDEKKEFYDQVDEGFLLLGKYLRDLWD